MACLQSAFGRVDAVVKNQAPASIAETLQALLAKRVKFLVAGGVAANLYGSRRLTMDLDLIPSLVASNWKLLLSALKELGFQPVDATWIEIENITRLQKWARPRDAISLRFRRRNPDLDIDILFLEGRDYDSYAARARLAADSSMSLSIVGKDDLIAMKRRAGRPKDLADIEAIHDAGV